MQNKISTALTQIVKSSGYEIWTERVGSVTHPVVLLTSGAAAHARFWTDLFCGILNKNGYGVIRYDHRDVGLTTGPDFLDRPYTIADLAHDAAAILNCYGISQAHVVGHSMGGIVTQLFASMYPERTLSMTCICCGPAAATASTDIPLTPEEKTTLAETYSINDTNKPTENFEESLPGFMRMWKRWNGTLPLDEDLVYAFTKEMYTRSAQKNLIKPHPHMRAVRLGLDTMEERRGLLQKISVPTLVIQGEEDYLLVPRRGGIALAHELPQAKLELIPGMGHMFFNRECQEMLGRLIVDFLDMQK
ncbi:MAG: hypothetical protein BGO14_11695 [Chlamydiales bacterium 38-26]|nr:alpha/beta hydrolase [Chlamydiales bacterium]OJV11602.1 MAG: hypothetical protein BGO14_11695 [Chlamydiales bacterium 38-26]